MGFVASVYPSLVEQNPTLVEAVIPIHGRYHEPSYDGEQFVLVHLELPELLLRTDTCELLQECALVTLQRTLCTVATSCLSDVSSKRFLDLIISSYFIW